MPAVTIAGAGGERRRVTRKPPSCYDEIDLVQRNRAGEGINHPNEILDCPW